MFPATVAASTILTLAPAQCQASDQSRRRQDPRIHLWRGSQQHLPHLVQLVRAGVPEVLDPTHPGRRGPNPPSGTCSICTPQGVVDPKTYAEGVVLTLHQNAGRASAALLTERQAMPLRRAVEPKYRPLQSSTAIACPKGQRRERASSWSAKQSPCDPVTTRLDVFPVVGTTSLWQAAMTAMVEASPVPSWTVPTLSRPCW